MATDCTHDDDDQCKKLSTHPQKDVRGILEDSVDTVTASEQPPSSSSTTGLISTAGLMESPPAFKKAM